MKWDFRVFLGVATVNGNFAESHRSRPASSTLLCANFLSNLGELNGE
jgi:hypothetical protein